MIYQRFIPEGWNQEEIKYSIKDLKNASDNNITLSGKITNIDRKHNAYVDLGNSIKGIIPYNELGEILKGNNYIQFKVDKVNEAQKICNLSRKKVKDER